MRGYLKRFTYFLILAAVLTVGLIGLDVAITEKTTLFDTLELSVIASWAYYAVVAVMLCGVFALFKL